MSGAGYAKRRRAHRWGHAAEHIAALMLKLKGYQILSMREKTLAGEIDLIVRCGETIAFVEVKARADEAAALEAVTFAKAQRLLKAAEAWRMRHPRYASHALRFDVITVSPWTWPRHMKDAWRA